MKILYLTLKKCSDEPLPFSLQVSGFDCMSYGEVRIILEATLSNCLVKSHKCSMHDIISFILLRATFYARSERRNFEGGTVNWK